MVAEIRWTRPDDDREVRVEVIRRAWHAAYSHIFSTHEIDAVFNGAIEMSGAWTDRRTRSAGTLVAVDHDEVVGITSLGLLEPGVGEVAALYVLPERQGTGIGRQMWHAGLNVLAHRGASTLEVWTLADGPARGFYEHLGCRLAGEADFALGDHIVEAVGYVADTAG